MKVDFYVKNRESLLDKIENNSMVVLYSGRAPKKSADEKYYYTPNRNFYYMTGIDCEEIILVLVKSGEIIRQELYIKRYDQQMAKWVGESISKEEAIAVSGINSIKYIDEFESSIGTYISRLGVENTYFDLERLAITEEVSEGQELANKIRKLYPYMSVKSVNKYITELRLIKSDEEVEEIKKALKITKEGIEFAVSNIKPDVNECYIEADFNYILCRKGEKHPAFDSIIAGGERATVLHYGDNNQVVKNGDLVLFDLGAQHNYYASDISRTFPANGKFTDRQKVIYNIVLEVQKEVEKSVKPGVTLGDLNKVTVNSFARRCKEIGLIEEDEEIAKYYYHGVSHFLGLNTHDVGTREVKLQPGMVITNEPGLYIQEERIGIRIEDDLLVTEDGCKNLSKDIMKEVEDIEAFMSK